MLFQGRLKSKDLEIGILTANKLLGKLDCNIEARLLLNDGKFKWANIDGEIYSIEANNYDYQNIVLNGLLEPENYIGTIEIDDPALDLDFKGLINLSNDSIILNFNTDLIYADFGSLNILPIKKYSSVSGNIKMDFHGKEWSSLLGKMDATQIAFCTDSSDFDFGTISLKNDTIRGGKELILKSDFLSGEIAGEYDIATIQKSIMWKLSNVMPSFIPYDSSYTPNQNFQFDFVFQDMSFLQTLSIFDIYIPVNSHLYGKIGLETENTNINFVADSLYLTGIEWKNPKVFINSNQDEISIEINSDLIQKDNGPSYFSNNTLKSYISEDTLKINFSWMPADSSMGELKFQTVFLDTNKFELTSDNSHFTFLKKEWTINNDGKITFESNSFLFSDINLFTSLQSIQIDGMYGRFNEDTLQVLVNNFELANFNYILYQYDYNLKGVSNGYINWIREDEILKLEAELNIVSAEIND
jgi:hypothetical protein